MKAALAVQLCFLLPGRPSQLERRASERLSYVPERLAGCSWLPSQSMPLQHGHGALRQALASGAVAVGAAQARRLRRAARPEAREENDMPDKEGLEEPLETEDDAQITEYKPPEPRKKRKVFYPAEQPGAMAPLGFFDPLGFCPPGDEGNFRQLRAAEIKHGRVAMLASVGLLAQSFIRIPAFGLQFAPSGIKAAVSIPSSWFCTLVLFGAMVMELLFWKEDPRKEPGDFGDPFGLGMYDVEMRNRELNNGRFAMFATAGIIASELATGKDAAQQLGLVSSLPTPQIF